MSNGAKVIPVAGPPGTTLFAGLADASADLKALNTTKPGQRTALAIDQVDNTPDAQKPVSVPQQAALDAKATKASPVFTGTAAFNADTVRVPVQATAIALRGQPPGILAGDLTQGSRQASTLGSMLFYKTVELYDSIGASASGVFVSSVAFYAGVTCDAGGGAGYGANFLAQSLSGHRQKIATLELNLNVDADGSPSGATPSQFLTDPAKQPNCYVSCIGNIASPISYVFGWNGLGGANQAYAGISFHNGTIQGPLIDDYTASTHIIRAAGSKTTGLDLSACTFSSGYASYMGNGHKIGWADANNTVSAAQIYASSGNLVLGGNAVFVTSHHLPLTDNVYSSGAGANRWTTVYAVNGVASSSDENLKTDIAAMDGATAVALVRALDVSTWRWKSGGVDWVDGTEEVEEQAFETDADGVKIYLYDRTPVLGEDGKQIVDRIPGREAIPEIKDPETGEILRSYEPAVEPMDIPRVEVTPRMEKVRRPCKIAKDRAGRRIHIGWLYQNVERALADLSLDLGILDKTEDGSLFLRQERMTAVLWAAWKHRDVEIEARLTRLEASAKAA